MVDRAEAVRAHDEQRRGEPRGDVEVRDALDDRHEQTAGSLEQQHVRRAARRAANATR
jgi:hypothetical protein